MICAVFIEDLLLHCCQQAVVQPNDTLDVRGTYGTYAMRWLPSAQSSSEPDTSRGGWFKNSQGEVRRVGQQNWPAREADNAQRAED